MSDTCVDLGDLSLAVEEGCFEMETPRVTVPQCQMDEFSISASRDTEHHRGGVVVMNTTVDVSIVSSGYQTVRLHADLLDHKHAVEGARVVLHGMEKLWDMQQPGMDLSLHTDDRTTVEADISWPKAEPIGDR
jgi:hypothetical protein